MSSLSASRESARFVAKQQSRLVLLLVVLRERVRRPRGRARYRARSDSRPRSRSGGEDELSGSSISKMPSRAGRRRLPAG
jgi:hypothetical protein